MGADHCLDKDPMQKQKFRSVFALATAFSIVLLPASGDASAQKSDAKARAQKSDAKASAVPGWTVQCSNPGDGLKCRASQTIMLKKTGQLLLSVAVNRPKGSPQPAMLVHLPHGLFIPAGTSIRIDKADPIRSAIQTCNAEGCYTDLRISNAMLASLSKGKMLIVSFQNLKKQTVQIQVSLKGFSDAYSKVQ